MEPVEPNKKTTEHAVFGGGCFWCTEAVFKMLRGIYSVMPGYAGGKKENPTYEDVCSGKSGHAEVISVEYDPFEIAYRDLLTVFFGSHDPTTLNRQGADVGEQYRSSIFYTTEDQKRQAENMIQEINESHAGGTPVVTSVQPLEKFYPAEDYHRDYYEKNKTTGYCQVVINPKLEKVQKRFAELLSEQK